MQAALLAVFVFPPPAARAEVLAHGDGTRTGRTTDAGHELVMQRVVRHMVDGHVVPHIAPGPLNQRVELGAALVVCLFLI